jgi:hypothetical protein
MTGANPAAGEGVWMNAPSLDLRFVFILTQSPDKSTGVYRGFTTGVTQDTNAI